MKRGPPGPPKGRIRNTPRREQQLDQALANSSPARASCGKVGTGFPQKRCENKNLAQVARFPYRAACSRSQTHKRDSRIGWVLIQSSEHGG